MERKRIFVTAKAFPVESSKYNEVVCTAGITDTGELIRVYPVPFRSLALDKRYKKYQWIEIDVEKRERNKDLRKESYKCNIYSLSLGKQIGTENNWQERKDIFINKTNIFTNYDNLLNASNRAKDDFISLAVFKPSAIIGVDYVKVNKVTNEKIKQLELDLSDEVLKFNPEPAKIMPFYFHYIFKDNTERECKCLIEDWEAYSLFWKYGEANPEKGAEIVKSKYESFIKNNDIYFFMGTRYRDHLKYNRNDYFSIISVFYPPKDEQLYFNFTTG